MVLDEQAVVLQLQGLQIRGALHICPASSKRNVELWASGPLFCVFLLHAWEFQCWMSDLPAYASLGPPQCRRRSWVLFGRRTAWLALMLVSTDTQVLGSPSCNDPTVCVL